MLKRIKPKRTLRKPKKKASSDPRVRALLRMSDCLLKVRVNAKSKEMALAYQTLQNDHLFLRIRQCIDKAKKEDSWDWMHGCFYQATEVYAVAALAYERYSDPLMSDELFDRLAKFLHLNYRSIPDRCKEEYNLNRGIFYAGTGAHFLTCPSPNLAAYNNRLQQINHDKEQKRARLRAKNRTRVLRKKPLRRIRPR